MSAVETPSQFRHLQKLARAFAAGLTPPPSLLIQQSQLTARSWLADKCATAGHAVAVTKLLPTMQSNVDGRLRARSV